MKILKILILTAILMISITLFLNASGSEFAGTTAGKLMAIEVDARINALGGAYCGYVYDLVGYDQNIAGVAELNEKQLMLGYSDWLADTSIQYIAFGMPITGLPAIERAVLATSFKFLSVPDFANKNQWGEDSGLIGMNNYIFSLGFSRKHNDHIKYGFNFKLNRESYTLDNNDLMKFTSLGLDLSAQYKFKAFQMPFVKKKHIVQGLQVGLSIQNIPMTSAGYGMPAKIKTGVVFPFVKSFVFLFDINKDIYTFGSLFDGDYRFNMGLEYKYKNMIFIRGGIKLGYNEDAFTIGAGFQKQFGSFLTMVNYGLGSHEKLGYLNNISLCTKFDKISFRTELPPAKRKLVEYHYYRGLSLFVQDEIEQAVKEWEEVLKIDPDNPSAIKRIKEAKKILKEREKIK